VAHLGQVALGLALLLPSLAMVLSLILLPIGLPLAFVSVALIAAPSDT
jgi:hypothetical protein